MIMYDWQCEHCNNKFEALHKRSIRIVTCPECGGNSYKIFPTKAPTFNLTYNPKKDMCDFDGNTTRYYDDYKKMKEVDKNARIPQLDGDG